MFYRTRDRPRTVAETEIARAACAQLDKGRNPARLDLGTASPTRLPSALRDRSPFKGGDSA
jgi:hypothetical protein